MEFQFTGNLSPCVSMLWCHEQTPHSLLMRVTEIWGNLFSSNLCPANIAVLTHCSLVTPQGVKVCVSIRTGSSLSFVCHQVISSNNDLSSIGPKLKWNLNQGPKLSVQYLHLKMSSAEWWPFVSRPQWVNTEDITILTPHPSTVNELTITDITFLTTYHFDNLS